MGPSCGDAGDGKGTIVMTMVIVGGGFDIWHTGNGRYVAFDIEYTRNEYCGSSDILHTGNGHRDSF